MRDIVKPFRRPPTSRIRDPQVGFPIGGTAEVLISGESAGKHSGSVAHASRCPASPQRTFLAENLGKPSLGVSISVLWYYAPATVMPSTRIVGAFVPYRKTRSFAGVRFRNMSFRFPATVISLTGYVISPFSIQ